MRSASPMVWLPAANGLIVIITSKASSTTAVGPLTSEAMLSGPRGDSKPFAIGAHSNHGPCSGISAKMFAGRAVLIFDTPPNRALVSACHAANSSKEVMLSTGLLA